MFAKDLGESLFQAWTDQQRRDEIEKLVEGYRNGVPLGILCRMALAIAGDKQEARRHLGVIMTPKERKDAVAKETGAMKEVAKEFLL